MKQRAGPEDPEGSPRTLETPVSAPALIESSGIAHEIRNSAATHANLSLSGDEKSGRAQFAGETCDDPHTESPALFDQPSYFAVADPFSRKAGTKRKAEVLKSCK